MKSFPYLSGTSGTSGTSLIYKGFLSGTLLNLSGTIWYTFLVVYHLYQNTKHSLPVYVPVLKVSLGKELRECTRCTIRI